MSYAEREALTELLTTLLVLVLFWFRLSGQAEAGLFDGPDGLKVWARSVLVLIGVSIVVAIGVAILMHIGYAIVTGEKKLDETRDERDRMIDLRALRVAFHVMSTGLLGVIITLALGGSALAALSLVLACCALGGVVRSAVKLIAYRRGG